MLVEIEGVVEAVAETQSFGEKGFRKRSLIIKKSGDWVQFLPLDLVNDDCDISINVGDNIKSECYVKGSNSLWNGKAFVNLTVRNITITGQSNESAEPAGEVPF